MISCNNSNKKNTVFGCSAHKKSSGRSNWSKLYLFAFYNSQNWDTWQRISIAKGTHDQCMTLKITRGMPGGQKAGLWNAAFCESLFIFGNTSSKSRNVTCGCTVADIGVGGAKRFPAAEQEITSQPEASLVAAIKKKMFEASGITFQMLTKNREVIIRRNKSV